MRQRSGWWLASISVGVFLLGPLSTAAEIDDLPSTAQIIVDRLRESLDREQKAFQERARLARVRAIADLQRQETAAKTAQKFPTQRALRGEIDRIKAEMGADPASGQSGKSPEANGPADEGLVIVSAMYVSAVDPSKSLDATEAIVSALTSIGLEMEVDPSTCGGDPDPDHQKILTIRYRWHGEPLLSTFKDGLQVKLPKAR